MAEERWLTVAEIAARLKVHEQTVRRWLRDGKLVGRNFGGRMGYRVSEQALARFMSENEPEREPEGKAAA